MRLELSDVLSWLPEAGILLIISFLVFVTSGWVSSVMVASKFKWLWLFSLFLLTNPVTIGILIYKRTTSVLIPLSFYMLGIAIWISGSNMLLQSELKQLGDHKIRITEKGEPIFSTEYYQEAPDPERSVWDHPFLKSLALEGQETLNAPGSVVPEQAIHTKLKLPTEVCAIRYEDEKNQRMPFHKPFKRLHQTYPDELDELAPAFTDAVPSDSVTGNQLPYRKHEADGFEIYSFGLNTKDNGGQSNESRHYHEQETHDDLLWTVQDLLKTVPSFSIENQNEGLQKRYGIIHN